MAVKYVKCSMHLLRQNKGSTDIAKKDKTKPLWPAVQPQSNFNKRTSLFPQLPQEIDKCTRRGTSWCRCELILSAHIPGWALEDLEDTSAVHLWLLGRLRSQQLWLPSQNEYTGNLVTHELTQHPLHSHPAWNSLYIIQQPVFLRVTPSTNQVLFSLDSTTDALWWSNVFTDILD